MTAAALRFASVALLIVIGGLGCAGVTDSIRQSRYLDVYSDEFSETAPPTPYSDDWWAIKAEAPVGARQKLIRGKLWPPFPRPTGEQQQFSHQYHTSHYWPLPYICQDRAYVKDLSQRQVNKGWISATTLYQYHFQPDSQDLTDSGRLHLRWILENAPPNQRRAWVQTGMSSEVSQQRMAAVKTVATEMVGEENIPPIMLRVASSVHRPADEIVRIRQAELETMPEPRVQYTALPTGTGSE